MTQASATQYGRGDESGPGPDAVPERARIIATIHAYAEWLAEHPEVPAPNGIVAHHHIDVMHQLPLADRIAAVERFATAQEIEAWRNGNTIGARLAVMSDAYPVTIDHVVVTSGNESEPL